MEPQTERWLALSEYDVGVAELLYQQAVYRYAVFFCQLGLEKLLKAILLERLGLSEPPRIHSLNRLAGLAGIDLPARYAGFLWELSAQATDARYPDDLGTYSQEFAYSTLSQAKEVYEWLRSEMA